MIEINLLPGGTRKKISSAPAVDFAALGASLSSKLGDKVLLGSVATMILAAAVGGWMYYKQGAEVKATEERLDKALKDSTRYASVVAARLKLEAKRDTLLRQVNLIRTIDGDRYIWPHVMDEVSRVLPPYTWITSLGFNGSPAGSVNVVAAPIQKPDPLDTAKVKAKPKVPTVITPEEVTVRIAGRTVDVQALTRFLKDLEDSPFINNVYLEGSSQSTENGKEVHAFNLVFSYSRPDSTVIRRVPLTASGR